MKTKLFSQEMWLAVPLIVANFALSAAPPTYRVYATREGLVGGTTANGHKIVASDHFCALPSRTALNANGAYTYTVTIRNPANGRVASNVPIWDVGPWNTKDNYWHSPRAMWTDLALGLPEAQAAYQNKYNGGKDEFGRVVANPAGIDLADGTFADLGNPTWVDVTYNWETAPGTGMRLDLFVRDANNACVHRFHAGSGWSTWENIGGNLASDPAACSWGSGRIDVMARGLDNAIWHKYWNVNAWSAWASLGENIVGGPEICSWGANRLDVFWRGTDNALWHKCWNGSNWTAAEWLGGVLTSDPTAVAWGPNRIDIFCRSTDNAMWHIYWGGTAWSSWENVGGVLAGAPDACSWAAGRIDVFVRGNDNQMYHNLWQGTTWSGWGAMGGNLASDPAATSYAYNRLDTFAKGSDNAIWTIWWNGSAWSAWSSLGGNCVGSPAVCSWTRPQ